MKPMQRNKNLPIVIKSWLRIGVLYSQKDLIDFVNFSDNNALNTYIKQENDFFLLGFSNHLILDFDV